MPDTVLNSLTNIGSYNPDSPLRCRYYCYSHFMDGKLKQRVVGLSNVPSATHPGFHSRVLAGVSSPAPAAPGDFPSVLAGRDLMNAEEFLDDRLVCIEVIHIHVSSTPHPNP